MPCGVWRTAGRSREGREASEAAVAAEACESRGQSAQVDRGGVRRADNQDLLSRPLCESAPTASPRGTRKERSRAEAPT